MTQEPKTDLTTLIERCREATGPDRELDFDLHDAMTGRTHQYAPAYTFSVHEALRIAEERALERWPDILRSSMDDLSKRFSWHTTLPTLGQLDLLPLAILLATLTVLQSQGDSDVQ